MRRRFPSTSPERIFTTGLFFLTLVFLDPARDGRAQTDPEEVELELRATTASRLEEPDGEVPGSASIIPKYEIENKNSLGMSEVLRDQPGVLIQSSGTLGESVSLTLRGAEPAQTLVLLDGVRLNSPFRGGVNLGPFLVDEIGQVEIVRGGQSALYGSEAMGGVVHLLPSRGSGPPKVSLTQRVGSEKTFQEVLAASGSTSSGKDYSVSVSHTATEGQFDRDQFDGTAISGQLGTAVGNRGDLRYTSRFQTTRKELATDIVPVSPEAVQAVEDQNSEIANRFVFNSIRYRYEQPSRFGLTLKAAILDTRLHWDNPADIPPTVPFRYLERTKTRLIHTELQQDVYLGNFDILSFGIERERTQVDSEGEFLGLPFDVDRSRWNIAYFVQNRLKWGNRFILQTGVRIDQNSGFGNVVNPRISSRYEFQSTETQVRASFGTGFRAPSIQELHFPLFGDDTLDPERSRSWEAGVRQPLFDHKMIVDSVFFRIEYRDLIQILPAGIENVGEARTQGIESGVQIHLNSLFSIKGNHTYLQAKDKDSDADLPFRPHHQGNMGVRITPTPNFVADLDLHMVSSQELSADFILRDGTILEGRSPGYARLDFSSTVTAFHSYGWLRESRISLAVKNLLNKDYQEIPGFPAPGIGILIGLTLYL